MKIYYGSYDGKLFETEEECKAYEDKMNDVRKIYLDHNGNPTDCQLAEILCIDNERALDHVYEKLYKRFSSTGIYKWDFQKVKWRPIKNFIEEYEKELAQLQEIVKKCTWEEE